MATFVLTCFRCKGRWLQTGLDAVALKQCQDVAGAGLTTSCQACSEKAGPNAVAFWILTYKFYGTFDERVLKKLPALGVSPTPQPEIDSTP